MCVRAFAVGLILLVTAAAVSAQEFTFDASEFQKKPFEFGGYLEAKQQHFRLNQDGAIYLVNFYAQPMSELNQTTLTLKPEGKLRAGPMSLNFRGHAEGNWETRGFDQTVRFDELYASYKPNPGLTLDAGKIPLKWGKGYAWSPVAFFERPKDPTDPELAREGFTMLTADVIRNFDGALRTIAFTPVVLPVTSGMNSDFGGRDHVNVGAKLYLLYHDTDIDFMFLNSGSRSRRFGLDFSRNLGSSLEVHGEVARIEDTQRQATNAAGTVTTVRREAATSFLLGLRYLTQQDTTWILEYYRNGPGFTQAELQGFYDFVDRGYAQYLDTGNDTALRRAGNLARSGYGRPNPGRNYLYLRVTQKEPFDILYFTPALTVIANTDDHSTSVTPELLYTGINNIELRMRAFFLNGGAGTEFGERQNSRRVELQARLYF